MEHLRNMTVTKKRNVIIEKTLHYIFLPESLRKGNMGQNQFYIGKHL